MMVWSATSCEGTKSIYVTPGISGESSVSTDGPRRIRFARHRQVLEVLSAAHIRTKPDQHRVIGGPSMKSDNNPQNVQVSSGRRQYVVPQLLEYGSISRITQGGVSTTRSDSGNNSMRPPFATTNSAPKKRR